MTLLEIVQRVLSAINSNNVNTIADTVEAEQVVALAQTIHEELLGEYPWPHLYFYGQLLATEVSNQFTLPSDVVQIDWIRYDRQSVKYITPEEMTALLDSRLNKNVDSVDSRGALTNKRPEFWSSIDDTTIIFDSYDGSLLESKFQCKMVRSPGTLITDEDVPDIPMRFHYVLLHGIMAEAFSTLKESPNDALRYEKKYKQGKIRMQRWAKRVNEVPSTYTNNYGRRGGAGRIYSGRFKDGDES